MPYSHDTEEQEFIDIWSNSTDGASLAQNHQQWIDRWQNERNRIVALGDNFKANGGVAHDLFKGDLFKWRDLRLKTLKESNYTDQVS